MEFEWDPIKAGRNERVHGVRFELAAGVFLDSNRIERIDDRGRYGEPRWLTVGLADGIELAVAYTVRGDSIRIISARKAERHEREDYWHGEV